MILRADEYPRCDQEGRMLYPAPEVLQEFLEIVRAPIGLAVVLGDADDDWERPESLEQVRGLGDIHLLCHGRCHKPLAKTDPELLSDYASLFGPDAVMVPPFNRLDQRTVDALAAEGFRYVCTGPETRRGCPDIKFTGIAEIPSAFYGSLGKERHLWEPEICHFGEWTCVTLHIGWEYWAKPCGTWKPLRDFCDRYRSDIRPWPEFLKNRTECG